MLFNSCAILFLVLGIFIGECKSEDGIDLNVVSKLHIGGNTAYLQLVPRSISISTISTQRNGQYKMEIQFLASSQELMVVKGYGTVSRPILYKNANGAPAIIMLIFGPMMFLSLVMLTEKCKADDGIDVNLFHQHDYQVKFERLELESYNKHYVEVSIVTFKYNRTMAVANGTFTPKIDTEHNLTVIVQVYKFMSNEYRHFPIRFAINLCKALDANVAGIRGFLKCGNYTGCPHPKGIKQHICNWFPDTSQLPPLIPDGQYKIQMEMLHLSQQLGVANGYGTISRPIAYKNVTVKPKHG